MMQNVWKQEGFMISTDKQLLDKKMIFTYLHEESYWSKGISREIFETSVVNTAFCFGVYKEEIDQTSFQQVGFARVISDRATFAYLDDVFVLPSHQGRGLAKWLVSVIVEHPELKHLNRFLLATRDAHGLYAQYGFQPARPAVYMEKLHKSHPSRSVNP